MYVYKHMLFIQYFLYYFFHFISFVGGAIINTFTHLRLDIVRCAQTRKHNVVRKSNSSLLYFGFIIIIEKRRLNMRSQIHKQTIEIIRLFRLHLISFTRPKYKQMVFFCIKKEQIILRLLTTH